MKSFVIVLAGLAAIAAVPAAARDYDRDYYGRGDGYRGDHYRGDRYRDGYRNYYRGDRGYRGGYGYRSNYGYRGGYYQPYYGRPYRSRVIVVPSYSYGYQPYYGGYDGGYPVYDRPVVYGSYGGGYGGGYYGGGDYYGGNDRYRCRSSGAGTVLGAIAGGLIGNAASGYYDRGAGTIIGAGIGAVAGTAIERDGYC